MSVNVDRPVDPATPQDQVSLIHRDHLAGRDGGHRRLEYNASTPPGKDLDGRRYGLVTGPDLGQARDRSLGLLPLPVESGGLQPAPQERPSSAYRHGAGQG